MSLTVEAIYEGGVLKPAQPLPLREHEQVTVTILPAHSLARQTAGMVPWTGDVETLERLARPRIRHSGDSMTFADLKAGDAVFVDANILIYHFTNHPRYGAACTALLERIEHQEIQGFTSSDCLSDVAHRIMTIEAMGRFNWPSSGLAARLKRHHAEIPKLTLYQQATAKVGQLGISVLPIRETLVLAATNFSQQFELLTGDALIVAVMHLQGLTKLASEDADFDRVPVLTRYAPV